MKYLYLLFFLFNVILFTACKDDKQVIFRGTVSDEISGVPISGARIEATYEEQGKDGAEWPVTKLFYTDATGAFDFTLERGASLFVYKKGYHLINFINAYDPVNKLDIRLIPLAGWKLRVENVTGQHDSLYLKLHNSTSNLLTVSDVLLLSKPDQFPLALSTGNSQTYVYSDPAIQSLTFIGAFRIFRTPSRPSLPIYRSVTRIRSNLFCRINPMVSPDG